jgi:hypothetical protein
MSHSNTLGIVVDKGSKVWTVLARKMAPQALRMNWNTLLRNGVFESGIGILPVGKNASSETQARCLCHDVVDCVDYRIVRPSWCGTWKRITTAERRATVGGQPDNHFRTGQSSRNAG